MNYKDALAATGAGKIIRRFPCVGGIVSGTVVESDPLSDGDAVIATSFDIGVAPRWLSPGYALRWVRALARRSSAFMPWPWGTAGLG